MIGWYNRAVMRLALLLAASLPLLFAASCSSNGAEETPSLPDVDAREALQRSLEAMKALQSYRVEVAYEGGPPSVIEFASPNDYHWISQTSDARVSETILVGDSGYLRSCKEVGKECSNWQEEARSSPTFAGILYSLQWPLVALEMTEPTELFDAAGGVSGASVGVRGSVDLVAAVQEAQRREQQATPPSSPISTFSSTIEISMSPADFLTHRLMISSTSASPGAQGPTWTVTYSNFNQVTVVPPA